MSNDTERPPCPRCAEWDAVPVGNGPKRRAALKAMGRSFAVHTCGIEQDGGTMSERVDALQEYRDALAGNESAEHWVGRDAFLHDLDDWIKSVREDAEREAG